MIRYVNNLDLAELRPYQTLKRPQEHRQQGIFIAEGAKVVERLLQSDLTVVSMLLTQAWYDILFAQNQAPPFEIFIAQKDLLETIVGFPLHQGIMAMAKVPLEEALQKTLLQLSRPFLLVALDGIVSAENVGVIVRNASAFGATAIISGETSSSPYLRRAVRNSMGAIFCLPVFHSTNLVEDLELLSSSWQTEIIGADPVATRSIYEMKLDGDICFVFGNEGDGLSKPVRSVCNYCLSIPMLNLTDSLNVSSASAVFLYEAQRARRKDKPLMGG